MLLTLLDDLNWLWMIKTYEHPWLKSSGVIELLSKSTLTANNVESSNRNRLLVCALLATPDLYPLFKQEWWEYVAYVLKGTWYRGLSTW